MARPIKGTPTLYGKDAERFIKIMEETDYKISHPDEFPEYHADLKKQRERQKKNFEIMKQIIKKSKINKH